MSSARPDGLGLRQTPDARVIQVRPYRARPTASLAIGVGLLALVGWAGARTWLPPDARPVVSLAAVAVWLLVAAAWAWGARRATERLEVYVGDHRMALVWSQRGVERRRQEHDLATVRNTVAGVGAVQVITDEGSWWLPMEAHSDEAIAWMVEHLREAGRGARKRA